jgi:hypothetical protein
MNTEKIYFISGVCGVGKTTLIPHLKKALPAEQYDIRDFDERGVPKGADHAWRKSELKNWLTIATASAKKGLSTVICGFAKKEDFEGLIEDETPEVKIILLDADPEIIRKRLIGRYTVDGVFNANKEVAGKPVDEFIKGNVYYCKIMREECEKAGYDIIDTSMLQPAEVAERVTSIILATKI